MSISDLAPFSTLPKDVILTIFSFLDVEDLKVTACVSKLLNELSSNSQLWQLKAEQRFGILEATNAKKPDITWKKTYNTLEALEAKKNLERQELLQNIQFVIGFVS